MPSKLLAQRKMMAQSEKVTKIQNQITARIIKLPYQNFIQKQLSAGNKFMGATRDGKCS